MKPSLAVKGETNFVSPRHEMCNLLIPSDSTENER